MNVYKALEAERNALAHGLYGICDAIPDGVVWIEVKDHVKHTIPWLAQLSPRADPKKPLITLNIDRDLFVYKPKDFEKLLQDMNELHEAAQGVAFFATWPDAQGAQGLHQVCELPQIQRELAHIRSGQKSKP